MPVTLLAMDSKAAAFANWLNEELSRHGMTQAELARRTGASSGLVNDWVRGKKRPEAAYCEAIARAFDLSVDVVLYHAGRISELPHPEENYEFGRELRRFRGLQVESEELLRRLEGLGYRFTAVAYRGRLPADSVRWVETDERQMMSVPDRFLMGRSPLKVFTATASGDCLELRKIVDGDLVFLEKLEAGQEPKNGDIVAIRLRDEVTLKIWHRCDDWIELRDGGDNVIARFSIADDFTVEGIYFARFG